MEIEVGSNFEDALRRFKRMVSKDGIHSRIKRRLAFIKPSAKRNAKRRMAEVRRRKRGMDGLDSRNEGAPSFRFIHAGGEIVKVPSERGEMHQHEG